MKDRVIRDIVFSPQSYSLSDIKNNVGNAIAEQKRLETVFGEELFKRMMDSDCVSDYQKGGGIYGIDKPSNLVVLWGAPHSGRTSAIFSLLALKGFKILLPTEQAQKVRISRIQNLFKKQKEAFLPNLSKGDTSDIYHAKYKNGILGKSYNISFFKPSKDYTSPEILQMLSSHQEQIHVFCIECRRSVAQQVSKHEEIIKFLEEKGFLQQSNAVYVLVTKSDLMNVPDIYEENAAQTFVTSGMPDFWHKIQEICYEKQIYNLQPVVFSIGNYYLKDYARLDTDYGQIFLEESILPKCQPNRNLLERFLAKGKRRHTTILLLLLFLLIAYGIYHVWNAIVPPPQEDLISFDYARNFVKREKGLSEADYEKAVAEYRTLREDLNVESSLHYANGRSVLPVRIRQKCDSLLTNDFAKALFNELDTLFKSENWTVDESRLWQLDSLVVELTENRTLTVTAITNYHQYIQDYFEQIQPLLSRDTTFTSVYEVRDFVSELALWDKPPYNTEEQLNRSLQDVKVNAYSSCAAHFQSTADNRIRKYNTDKSEKGSSNWLYFFKSSELDKLKRTFQKRNESLVQDISLLISDLQDTNDSRLIEIKKQMEQTRESIIRLSK